MNVLAQKPTPLRQIDPLGMGVGFADDNGGGVFSTGAQREERCSWPRCSVARWHELQACGDARVLTRQPEHGAATANLVDGEGQLLMFTRS